MAALSREAARIEEDVAERDDCKGRGGGRDEG